MIERGGDTVRGWRFDWQELCCVMDKSDGAVELGNVSLTLNWRYFPFSTFPSTVHIACINSKSHINTLAVWNLIPCNNTLLRHSIALSERAWTVTKTGCKEGKLQKIHENSIWYFYQHHIWYDLELGKTSTLHRLTNHITKIPNCQKIRLFCGKWLTIKTGRAASKNHLAAAHGRMAVLRFSISVSQFQPEPT